MSKNNKVCFNIDQTNDFSTPQEKSQAQSIARKNIDAGKAKVLYGNHSTIGTDIAMHNYSSELDDLCLINDYSQTSVLVAKSPTVDHADSIGILPIAPSASEVGKVLKVVNDNSVAWMDEEGGSGDGSIWSTPKTTYIMTAQNLSQNYRDTEHNPKLYNKISVQEANVTPKDHVMGIVSFIAPADGEYAVVSYSDTDNTNANGYRITTQNTNIKATANVLCTAPFYFQTTGTGEGRSIPMAIGIKGNGTLEVDVRSVIVQRK